MGDIVGVDIVNQIKEWDKKAEESKSAPSPYKFNKKN